MGHITKAWHLLVKALIQSPPRDLYGVLGASMWWMWGLDFIGQNFTCIQAKELYLNGLRYVDDIWDMESSEFISWQEVQNRFGFNEHEEEGRKLMTRCIMGKWHNILGKNWDN